jgi:hypothetical protein
MTKKTDITPFEAACGVVELMSEQERLALLKLLSVSLGGPHLYTDADVRAIVQGALDEHVRRGRSINAAATIMGKAN